MNKPQRLISVVTPCFNEEDNAQQMYEAIRDIFRGLDQYAYEHIFIDNASRDATPRILRALASADPRVKVIFNNRNFGPVRSPVHGLLQARGEAVIGLAADFQDPPELIPELLARWENGARVVQCVKSEAEESRLMYAIRGAYYRLLARVADIEIVQQATGFGLYDRSIMEAIRDLADPNPYFRGLVSEIGATVERVSYRQPQRTRGVSKNSLYTLIDIAMLGLITHTRVPLRLATLVGLAVAAFSVVIGLGYMVAKLLFWDRFSLGIAPIVVGFFLFSSVQLIFIGFVGEYVGAILTHVQARPLVFERERLNFDPPAVTAETAQPPDTASC